MTALENVDEEKEIERLRNILRDSNAHLSESNDMKNESDHLNDFEKQDSVKGKNKRKSANFESKDINEEESESDSKENSNNKGLESILSPVLQEGFKSMGDSGDSEQLINQSR